MNHMISIKLANNKANQNGIHSLISDDGKWLIFQNLYFKEIGKTMIDENNMVSRHAVNMIIATIKKKES